MLNIVCIRAGEAFPAEYVAILHDMVRRNLAEGYEGRFICFTDRLGDLDGVETRPLPADLPGWWSKLALHRPGLFPDGDRVLFFDLDTVITDSFDELAGYAGPFATLRDFYRPLGLQSAVMAWAAGETAHIWESYQAAGCPQDIPGGDQAWIERSHPKAVRLQDAFPQMFVSYKQISGIPSASICVFHGKPRPHEVLTGWVPQVWKVGGLTGASLTAICNTERTQLFENIRSSMARHLPWFDFDNSANDDHVVIVGGGPSLADTFPEIRKRHELGQRIWALNGTAHWLASRGVIPDAHFIVDARPENADFVRDAQPTTVHYVASQADAAVFDALKGKKVVLWHANSAGVADLVGYVVDKPVHLIGGGSTVGLNAISMAYLLGYRAIHLHGFDSSYRDGQHHAYPQAMNESEKVVDALLGERHFKAAPWMIHQVNEFQDLAASLAEEGAVFTVAGDGLLPHMARRMSIPLTAAAVRANEVLTRIAGLEQPVGAEIGVFAGDMSARLLDGHRGLTLHMVDSWEGSGAAYADDSDWHAALTDEMQNGYMEHSTRKTAFAQTRRHLIRSRSTAAAAKFAAASLDFVFIDADHSYEGCRSDIEAWSTKVKPGGWLCGHDFAHPEYPEWGVERAVREFVDSAGLTLELGENMTWFVKVPETVKLPSQEIAA